MIEASLEELVTTIRVLVKQSATLIEKVESLEARMPRPALATIAEAAVHLNESKASVRRQIKAGILPQVRIGKRAVRVDLSRLKSFDLEDVKSDLRKRGL